MNWKSWPYWVKGGIVALFISLVALVVGIWLGFAGELILLPFLAGPTMIANLLFGFKILSFDSLNLMFLWVLVVYLVFYFLFGAFIGYLYGKIKNRKSLSA